MAVTGRAVSGSWTPPSLLWPDLPHSRKSLYAMFLRLSPSELLITSPEKVSQAHSLPHNLMSQEEEGTLKSSLRQSLFLKTNNKNQKKNHKTPTKTRGWG